MVPITPYLKALPLINWVSPLDTQKSEAERYKSEDYRYYHTFSVCPTSVLFGSSLSRHHLLLHVWTRSQKAIIFANPSILLQYNEGGIMQMHNVFALSLDSPEHFFLYTGNRSPSFLSSGVKINFSDLIFFIFSCKDWDVIKSLI